MKIFNEATLHFAHRCEHWLREILRTEVALPVKRTRFQWERYSYPIHVVVFENNSHWGWFDPHTYQIGLNLKLLPLAKDQLIKDILRHELAHYLTFIDQDIPDQAHGKSFQATCQRYGWSRLVSKASLDLDHDQLAYAFEKKDRLLTKVKHLMALARSENKHEAELATLKANQLLIKHNLQQNNTNSESLYCKTILSATRRSAKLSTIYDILKHFLVAPVFIYGKKQVLLEVSGSKDNIELAEYIAIYLERELERLWQQQTELKGLRAKNAFFLGIAKGYEAKLKGTPQSRESSKELIAIKKDLHQKVQLAYRRLSSTRQGGASDNSAFVKGTQSGKNLHINKAVKQKKQPHLIAWRAHE